MYCLDNDMNIHEANETTVYRVFGGDSSMEGGYVTCELPKNPIQARCDLALSQHDFIDDEGSPVRNLASQVATGFVYTDDENHIVDISTGQVTDNVLQFDVVDPTSDMLGGGLEYHLEDDFSNVVEVDNIDELRHQPTEGWTAYIEAESKIIADSHADGEGSLLNTSTDDTLCDVGLTDPDDGIDDEWYADSSTDTLSVDTLLEDEEYFLQKDFTNETLYDDAGWIDPDEGMGERCLVEEWYADSYEEESLNSLIDEELYQAQSADVKDNWTDINDYTDDYESVAENDYSNDNY